MAVFLQSCVIVDIMLYTQHLGLLTFMVYEQVCTFYRYKCTCYPTIR